MKASLYFLVLLCLAATFHVSYSQNSEKKSGNIFLTIVGLDNDVGDIKIGLFNSAQSFEGTSKEKFGGAIIPIHNKKAQHLFSNVPYGEYAIKLFHDEDGDDDADTNFLVPFQLSFRKYSIRLS
jgi:uncharacterized protein (DUF2141 family)